MPDNKCKRCGMCCKGRGDMAGVDESLEDCSELSFDSSGLAVCGVHQFKPSICQDYPFPDMDNGMCERQQKKAGVWIEYYYIDKKLIKKNQKGEIIEC